MRLPWVRGQEEEWKKKGLSIFWLPTYSSELNIIEILWRLIKYSWPSNRLSDLEPKSLKRSLLTKTLHHFIELGFILS